MLLDAIEADEADEAVILHLSQWKPMPMPVCGVHEAHVADGGSTAVVANLTALIVVHLKKRTKLVNLMEPMELINLAKLEKRIDLAAVGATSEGRRNGRG